MDFQPVAIGFEPTPDVDVLVIGSVVLNQNGSLPAVRPRQLLQEPQVAGSIKDCVLPIMETGTPQFNSAQDFDVLALSSDGNLRRMADPAPSGMQGRVLAETGFVGKDQRPVLRAGFFLRLGYVYRCQRSRSAASALAKTRFGRCTEKPIS